MGKNKPKSSWKRLNNQIDIPNTRVFRVSFYSRFNTVKSETVGLKITTYFRKTRLKHAYREKILTKNPFWEFYSLTM